jgi:predicted ATP-grasp superfamily ATP-dependent carboligase
MNINLFSQIGMILLIGLVTKNAILLVDFANQEMSKGKSARDAMLKAILQDLAEQPKLELIILRDSRLDEIASLALNASCEFLWTQDIEQFDRHWNTALQHSDTTLLIAPETDNQLTNIQQTVLDHAKTYLGSSQQATELCSNKLRCFQYLFKHNIPTVHTQIASQWQSGNLNYSDGIVIKPIDGAGCVDTAFFNTSFEAKNYLQDMSSATQASSIVQPYVKGKPASLSLFISDNKVSVLSINHQQIQQQNSRLIFQGSTVNTIPANELSPKAAQSLADNIHRLIPELWGFVGIDLVLTPSGPIVIEVNPRLTSSYIELKSTLNTNPTDILIKYMSEKISTRFIL